MSISSLSPISSPEQQPFPVKSSLLSFDRIGNQEQKAFQMTTEKTVVITRELFKQNEVEKSVQEKMNRILFLPPISSQERQTFPDEQKQYKMFDSNLGGKFPLSRSHVKPCIQMLEEEEQMYDPEFSNDHDPWLSLLSPELNFLVFPKRKATTQEMLEQKLARLAARIHSPPPNIRIKGVITKERLQKKQKRGRKGQIHRNWSRGKKDAIVEEINSLGIQAVAKKYNIHRMQVDRWRRETEGRGTFSSRLNCINKWSRGKKDAIAEEINSLGIQAVAKKYKIHRMQVDRWRRETEGRGTFSSRLNCINKRSPGEKDVIAKEKGTKEGEKKDNGDSSGGEESKSVVAPAVV